MEARYTAKTKYDDRVADRYRNESEGRRRRENEVLRRVFADVGIRGPILDAPCGVGRVIGLLPDEAVDYTGIDISTSMLERAGERLADRPEQGRLLRADLEALPLADRGFDLTLCLRLLHHLPADVRETVILELARVTDRILVVTFFHPFALHFVKRKVKGFLRGWQNPRFSHRTHWLTQRLEPLGFRLRAKHGTGFLKETWCAVYERSDSQR